MKLKDIKGFEGLYAVTEDGRVWSYLTNKWRKLAISPKGYYTVQLSKEGKVYNFLVHRLVYETFKGEIPEGLTVDHIDGNKINNTPDNLQLLTSGENTSKAWKGRKRAPFSDEWKRKLSEAQRGINNPMYGKKHTEETRRKISVAHKGEKHPFFGKKHSEETRRKMAEARRIYWAKRKLNA
jgi:hypothetical protein